MYNNKLGWGSDRIYAKKSDPIPDPRIFSSLPSISNPIPKKSPKLQSKQSGEWRGSERSGRNCHS